ncbi:MAG: RluA family pseudouridine synthase [Omnitrophica bacterium]|nr:RluA family pseudouridine synthase [Candidatus Omnitrophota bacterium]
MEEETRFILKVSTIDKDLRLDQYIIKNLEFPISRSRIQRLIDAGKVTVNSKRAKAHYKVKPDDTLLIKIPEVPRSEVLPEKIPLEIVFEDEDILVINKPPGLVSHPAPSCPSGTLVNALLNYGCALSTINGPSRPGIVHRLDKDTSGLLVIAKNDSAHLDLAKQFCKHTVKRKYIAMVKGRVEHNEGIIDYPLARDPQNYQKMRVSFINSRDALTRYRVLNRYKEVSILELSPHTGRTHQLRVHLKFCGHPILGDKHYGDARDLDRLSLHATELGFYHPRTKKFVEFQSDIPESFKRFIKGLKQ